MNILVFYGKVSCHNVCKKLGETTVLVKELWLGRSNEVLLTLGNYFTAKPFN